MCVFNLSKHVRATAVIHNIIIIFPACTSNCKKARPTGQPNRCNTNGKRRIIIIINHHVTECAHRNGEAVPASSFLSGHEARRPHRRGQRRRTRGKYGFRWMLLLARGMRRSVCSSNFVRQRIQRLLSIRGHTQHDHENLH